MQPAQTYDAIIVGAGAAGLYCAAIAGQRGRRILLIDHSSNPGAKILISGGGRCNFTNIGATAANFLSANQHFAKSAMSRHLKFPPLELFGSSMPERTTAIGISRNGRSAAVKGRKQTGC